MQRKLRDNYRIVCIAILYAMLFCLHIYSVIYPIKRMGYITIVVIIISAILATESIPSKNNITHNIRKSLIVLVVAIGVTFCVNAVILQDTNKLIIGVSFGILAPTCSIFLSEQKNRRNFLLGFSVGSIVTFYLLFLASVIYAPILYNGQYYSILLNPNGLSTELIAMLLSVLYILKISTENQGKTYKFALITLGFVFMFMLLSMSRTGMLAFIVMVLVYFLFCRKEVRMEKSKAIKSALVLIMSALLCAGMLTVGARSILKVRANDAEEVHLFIKKQHGNISSEIVLEALENLDSDSFDEDLRSRYFKGADGEDISSGRISIWKATIKELKVAGHESQDTYYVPEREIYTNDAHNMYLDVGYSSGIFGMICVFMYMALDIWYCINSYSKNKKEKHITDEGIMQISVILAFFVLSALSSTYTPLGSATGILFWQCSSWKIEEESNEQKKRENKNSSPRIYA